MERTELDDHTGAPARRAFLLRGAAWQDALLQSYRTMHLIVQGALLAAGTATALVVVASPVVADSRAASVATLAVLALLAALHLAARRAFGRLVRARAADVDWWHVELLREERALAEGERTFTRFKRWQRERAGRAAGGDDDAVERLVEKGHGHTRLVVDGRLLAVPSALWLALLLASGALVALRWPEMR